MKKRKYTAKEYHNIILSIVASASLADHMGDMWNDLNEVLGMIGEIEIRDADQEYDEEQESSELSRIFRKRNIKTVWGSDFL